MLEKMFGNPVSWHGATCIRRAQPTAASKLASSRGNAETRVRDLRSGKKKPCSRAYAQTRARSGLIEKTQIDAEGRRRSRPFEGERRRRIAKPRWQCPSQANQGEGGQIGYIRNRKIDSTRCLLFGLTMGVAEQTLKAALLIGGGRVGTRAEAPVRRERQLRERKRGQADDGRHTSYSVAEPDHTGPMIPLYYSEFPPRWQLLTRTQRCSLCSGACSLL